LEETMTEYPTEPFGDPRGNSMLRVGWDYQRQVVVLESFDRRTATFLHRADLHIGTCKQLVNEIQCAVAYIVNRHLAETGEELDVAEALQVAATRSGEGTASFGGTSAS
jgi:hypothetical protein